MFTAPPPQFTPDGTEQPQPPSGSGALGGILGGSPTDVVEIMPQAPAELPQKPSLKTDSVEMVEGSNAILDNLASAPKLDPSKLNEVGKEFPAALVPPYAFHEPPSIAKTVENRASATDFRENQIRKQLDEALKNKGKL